MKGIAMAELLDRNHFSIDVNRYNPNGFCLIHVDLNDDGAPVDWTFIYVNEALCRMEGKTEEELTGHRFYDLFPDGSRKWLDYYYKAAYEHKSVSFDDVSEEIGYYLHIDAYPTDDVGYCICMLHDIRDRMLSNLRRHNEMEALITQLERERLNAARVREFSRAMGIDDPLAINLNYTSGTYHMLEYEDFIVHRSAPQGDIDTLVRDGASSIPDPELAEEYYRLFNRESAVAAFRRGERVLELRHPQTGDDGTVHTMDSRVICTECADDRVRAIALSKIVDRESERDRYVRVVDALSTIYTTIMLVDLKRRTLNIIRSVGLMSKAVGGSTFVNFDEVIDSVLDHFMHPSSRAHMREFLEISTIGDRLMGTDETTLRTEYLDPKGQWFESRFITQSRDASGRPTFAIYAARNITYEKETELRFRQDLQQAVLEAQKANTSKTNFLRRMSHDIRTPLNGIMGMLHIMNRYEGDKDKFHECMDKILHSTNYLLTLVNNVLDISKMESGTIVLEHKPFDLFEALRTDVNMMSGNASENGIAFSVDLEHSRIRHRYVVGSPMHLNRVLMNIASNAVKYNRPGGTITVWCNELDCDGECATYAFSCEDTGLGMSEEFQKHAFDPFTQEGKETLNGYTGSGLGLSIVHDIVKLMGGTIELKSKENVGTTVRIVLTLPLDKEHVQPRAQDTPRQARADVRGKRALLVEDNAINAEIGQMMLEELGLVVTGAGNGQIALNVFNDSAPYTFDYVFMDMMMPVMDGLEAARRLRALPREDAKTVPVIAMTANAFAEDKQNCLDAGMNDHVGKPISLSALDKIVQKYAKGIGE